jgi:hypothetical protein
VPDFDDSLDESATPAFWASSAWGFSGLLIGCTLLLSACTLMVFNVILFRGGLFGIPAELARVAGIVGVAGVACLGLLAVGCGVRGWLTATGGRGAVAFGVAGTAAALAGLVAWLIAGADLLAILGVFE